MPTREAEQQDAKVTTKSTSHRLLRTTRNLASMAIAASCLATGCTDTHKYDYDGKIGQEQVKFGSSYMDGNTTTNNRYPWSELIVTKTNGTQIIFETICGAAGHYLVNNIKVVNEGNETIYQNFSYGEAVIQEGQRQLDSYLLKILDSKEETLRLKTIKGLEDLRR